MILFFLHALVLFFLAVSAQAVGQTAPGLDKEAEANEAANEEEDTGYAEEKTYSRAERREECKRYRGRYVAYYDQVYYVDDCRLRPIASRRALNKILTSGKKIHAIDHDTVAQLQQGTPLAKARTRTTKRRRCRQLERKYVTFSYTDVFYVQSCKKRPFPDWATFIEHRKRHRRQKDEVIALAWEEFQSLRIGQPVPSAVDKEFSKLMTGEAGVDVIPIGEACRGLNGKDVSYVSRIYRIQGCRKRAYVAEDYVRKKKGRNFKLKELTAEQWLSIPDGTPMPTRKKQRTSE